MAKVQKQTFSETDKFRNFWFLVYPDSAIPNWQDELNKHDSYYY